MAWVAVDGNRMEYIYPIKPSKEEDSDRIMCENALISYEKKRDNSNGDD